LPLWILSLSSFCVCVYSMYLILCFGCVYLMYLILFLAILCHRRLNFCIIPLPAYRLLSIGSCKLWKHNKTNTFLKDLQLAIHHVSCSSTAHEAANEWYSYTRNLKQIRPSYNPKNEIVYNFKLLHLLPLANNESSEVIDILLPVTFYFNPSTRLDVKNIWRFVISIGNRER